MPTYATPEMPKVAALGADWTIPGSPISAKGDMLYWDEKEGKFLPEKPVQQTEPWMMPPYTGLPTGTANPPPIFPTNIPGQRMPNLSPTNIPTQAPTGAPTGVPTAGAPPSTPTTTASLLSILGLGGNQLQPWEQPLKPWEQSPWSTNPLASLFGGGTNPFTNPMTNRKSPRNLF